MSKKRRKSDSKQLSLFDYLKNVQALDKKSSKATLNIGPGIRRALAEGIKQCPCRGIR